MKVAMSALAAIASYLSLADAVASHGQWRLKHHDLSQYMKLDASALKALNLMPNPLELGGNKSMSLYGLLNHCKTAQGQRLLAMWLKQPLVNLHEISEWNGRGNARIKISIQSDRLMVALIRATAGFSRDVRRGRQHAQSAAGEYPSDLSATRQESLIVQHCLFQSDCLRPMPDFNRINKRFNRGIASLEDVVRVYQAVSKVSLGSCFHCFGPHDSPDLAPVTPTHFTAGGSTASAA
jgi:DNA mismatch repair protein MSH2